MSLSLWLFPAVCIPLRYLIDTTLISNGMYYGLAAIGISFAGRFLVDIVTDKFRIDYNRNIVWSRLAVAVYYFIIAGLVMSKKISEALLVTKVTLLTSLIRHLEVRLIHKV
jgi:hypothetical protein